VQAVVQAVLKNPAAPPPVAAAVPPAAPPPAAPPPAVINMARIPHFKSHFIEMILKSQC